MVRMLLLEPLHAYARTSITGQALHYDIRVATDMARDTLVCQLEAEIIADRIEPVVSHGLAPASPWQHVKERYFPRRLRNRFPVRYALRGGHVVADRWNSFPFNELAIPYPPGLGQPIAVQLARTPEYWR